MLLSDIGITIPLLRRGASGIPSTDLVVSDLAGRCTSYEQTIAARGGFESMRIPFVADLDEAIDIFNTWLGHSTVVTGPDTQIIWEGQLAEISVTLGQRRRSIGLDKLANRLRCRYTDTNGVTATTSPTSDSASIALYGTKDAVISMSHVTSTTASGAAARALAQWKNPQQQPSTRIETGGGGNVVVELLFRGWYWTLGWVVTSRASTTATATGTQIGDLVQTSGVGIGVTNAFLSASRAFIGTTGVSATEEIAEETTFLEKIDQLVAQGDGVDRWVLMCLDGRQLNFRKWAGATPSTIDYIASLGGREVLTPEGRVIEPWDVRPDAMYQEVDLLSAAPVGTAYDGFERQYVERVVCQVSGDRIGVTLEPQASDSLDVVLRGVS